MRRPLRRVAVEHVRPSAGGTFSAKATVGLPLEVSADIFADGHDQLRAWALFSYGELGTGPAARVDLEDTGNDRWVGAFAPDRVGPWQFVVVAVVDDHGTWLRDLRLRLGAGQDIALELEEGALMVERRLNAAPSDAAPGLRKLRDGLRSKKTPAARLEIAASPAAVAVMAATLDVSAATTSAAMPLWVDRELAGFGAWYEMFPRSEGATAGHPGTFATAAKRLPAIAAMGFDVVYLPPIHPIGSSFRKGPNNTLDAAPGDPGSPWAIGSSDGGHTAVNPDLGDLRDFDRFVVAARRAGLEVALDYAIQCSPDHPWVTERPQWFRHRSDGTIRYAENPPKRYQDIYPLDFETEDREGLYAALRDVLEFWIAHDVKVFRVDNPHTKALDFWEWVIDDVHRVHPDVIFLAEAFTRPRMMERLARLGFTQSYTYFTWRNTREELAEYLSRLSQTEMVDWFRPNFWVNTPDILHAYLQEGGPAAFRVRAVLAAMTAPSWGMYSGYELCENVAVSPGSEEYLDSEKYQLRPRDHARADSLAPLVTTLNGIRRRHREAVALLRNLRVQRVEGDAILCVSRRNHAGDDVLLMVCNLDPHNVREATLHLDLTELGVGADAPFKVVDELDGASYSWRGPANYVLLDPRRAPAHVFHVVPAGVS